MTKFITASVAIFSLLIPATSIATDVLQIYEQQSSYHIPLKRDIRDVIYDSSYMVGDYSFYFRKNGTVAKVNHFTESSSEGFWEIKEESGRDLICFPLNKDNEQKDIMECFALYFKTSTPGEKINKGTFVDPYHYPIRYKAFSRQNGISPNLQEVFDKIQLKTTETAEGEETDYIQKLRDSYVTFQVMTWCSWKDMLTVEDLEEAKNYSIEQEEFINSEGFRRELWYEAKYSSALVIGTLNSKTFYEQIQACLFWKVKLKNNLEQFIEAQKPF